MDEQKTDLSSLRISKEDREGTQRPANWKTRALVAGAVILVLGGTYVLVQKTLQGAPEVELVPASLTYPSQANAVLAASGYVVAQQKAAVASKGTGRLEYLGVEEGDKVKKGQIIARLEDQDVIAALSKATADFEIARADSFDAQQTLARATRLSERGLLAQADLDAAEARSNRVRASIRSAQAAVRAAQVALENTRIRAPFDGTVLTKDADVGEVVAPFASSANSRGAVVTMADMSSLLVEADVSESNITRVRVGQTCEIVLDAYPDQRYPGTVHKIVPTADRAKATVLTKVAFKKRDERVLPEMSAKVTFLSAAADSVAPDTRPRLTVPASAVATRDGKTIVLLVRNGHVIETPVRNGAVMGSRVEILEGLSQGDQVILQPTPALTTGMEVKPRAK